MHNHQLYEIFSVISLIVNLDFTMVKWIIVNYVRRTRVVRDGDRLL